MKKKIALIFGGQSAEHEVSVNSAKNIFDAVDKNIYDMLLIGISKNGTWYLFEDSNVFLKFPSLIDEKIQKVGKPVSLITENGSPFLFHLNTKEKSSVDAAFPIIHGTHGEDGCIQGLFKMMSLPFVGCDVLSCAAGMDKDVMKKLFLFAGIKTARFFTLTRKKMMTYSQLQSALGNIFFIKPVNMGSSVGVHKIKNEADFNLKINDSFLYDHKVIAEEFIQGREIECSVLGLNDSARASIAGEVVANHEFYSYEAKYLDPNGAAIVIPAKLSESKMQEVRALAVKTFETLNCDGLTRVDFFLKENGELYVNEINTLPGFTKISMYPKMWEATGLAYTQLISELIALAFEKYKADKSLKTTFDAAVAT